MRSLRIRRLASLLVLAAVLGGCDSALLANPSPTPADFTDLASAVGMAGITLAEPVSGDPGCKDGTLAPTAIRMKASGLDQTAPVTVYLYMFADRPTYQRLRPEVDLCARSYVTDPSTYETIAVSPFVLAGQGPWAPTFKARLQTTLAKAAGTGG